MKPLIASLSDLENLSTKWVFLPRLPKIRSKSDRIIASPLAMLLRNQVIFNGCNALDVLCKFTRLVNVGFVMNEAT